MDKKPKISTIDELRSFLKDFFENKRVEIYLFGSRARGDFQSGSDIDLAILSEEPLSEELAVIREILEESNLPYKVDLVELRYTNEKLKQKVIQEGIKWI